MNCIIIDDEATARAVLQMHCSKLDDVVVTEEFPNAIEAIKFLNKSSEKVDVILLDINMPDFNGFDFIETLSSPPEIILTTSHKSFALDAFEYSCIVDYLVKPIEFDRLQKAVEKAKIKKETAPISKEAISNLNANGDGLKEIYVNIDRRLIKIDLNDIYLVEAKGDYINVKTPKKNYIVHSTLKKMEEKLPKDRFLKVHRSYVINVARIIDIEDNSVLIEKDVVPVSRSNRGELMKRLNLL